MAQLVAEQGGRTIVPGLAVGDLGNLVRQNAAAGCGGVGVGAIHVLCGPSTDMVAALEMARVSVMVVNLVAPSEMAWFMDAAYLFIDRVRESDDTVFVDMAAPMALACTVAYLMKKYGHSLSDALEIMRLDIPSPQLIQHLQTFENLGCGASSSSSRISSPRGRSRRSPHASSQADVSPLRPTEVAFAASIVKPQIVLQPVPKSAFVTRAPMCLSAH